MKRSNGFEMIRSIYSVTKKIYSKKYKGNKRKKGRKIRPIELYSGYYKNDVTN